MFRRKSLLIVCLIAVALAGCEKKESAENAPAPQATQTAQPAPEAQPAATEGFGKTLPSSFPKKAIAVAGKANAELINKSKAGATTEVKKSEPFQLEGWAVADKTKSVPDQVAVELVPTAGGDKYYAPATRTPRKRADVASFFKVPEFEKSNYVVKADLSNVPAGEYEIIIIQVINGVPSRAYPGKKIKIS